jgi:hypothetical protein
VGVECRSDESPTSVASPVGVASSLLHTLEVTADSDPKQLSRERLRPHFEGSVGVDVPCVISGCLITSILRRVQIRAGRIPVLRFIARRGRRSSSARVLAEECAPVVADVVVYYDPYPFTKAYADCLSTAVAEVLKPARA